MATIRAQFEQYKLEMVVEVRSNAKGTAGTAVTVKSSTGRVERMQLDSVPLKYLYFYKYIWAVFRDVRRRFAVVVFHIGKKRGKLHVDGRFEYEDLENDSETDHSERQWFLAKCIELVNRQRKITKK